MGIYCKNTLKKTKQWLPVFLNTVVNSLFCECYNIAIIRFTKYNTKGRSINFESLILYEIIKCEFEHL